MAFDHPPHPGNARGKFREALHEPITIVATQHEVTDVAQSAAHRPRKHDQSEIEVTAMRREPRRVSMVSPSISDPTNVAT